MKCKLSDQAEIQILRKNDSHANEIVFKNNFLPTLNQNITQVVYDKINNKKQEEEQTLNAIDRFDTKFKSERTRKIWKKLEKSCTSKSRTRWKDSLEGTYFLQVLHVDKRFISCEAKENEKISKYHVQPCNCMDFRATNENMKKLDSLTGSDEECNSPCCCPKYFTSKSGLVFESLDEVRFVYSFFHEKGDYIFQGYFPTRLTSITK